MAWRAKPLADSSDSMYAEVAKSHTKRNCLVIGPAGSGKLSLARGLAALANSRARKFLFDWEVEAEAQERLLADISYRLRRGVNEPEIWIQRKLQLIRGEFLAELLNLLRPLHSADAPSVICYATCDTITLEGEPLRVLEEVFPVRITLGEGGFVHGAFDELVSSALSTLGQKYGQRVISIEPDAIRFLERLALTTRMHDMLNALERAFLIETGPELRLVTLQELCGAVCELRGLDIDRHEGDSQT